MADFTISKAAITGSVSIGSSAVYGQTLTATVTGGNTNDVTYQWYRGDAPISGATNSTYQVTADDIDQSISAQVTAASDSYYTGYLTSNSLTAGRAAPTDPSSSEGYSINYVGETISANTGYELASNNSAATGESSLTLTPGNTSYEVYIRKAGTTTHTPSNWVAVTIPARPTAPDEETVIGGNRQISGLDTTMEYLAPASGDETPQWTAITDGMLENGVLSNLEPGIYRVRYAAVTGENPRFASESIAVQVTRPSGSATYPPIVTDTENGTVAFTPAAPIWGQRVTITPKPDEGFAVDSVTVTDRNGDPISVSDNQDGAWSFIQPSGRVTITVTFRPTTHVCPSESFTDVDQAAWYHAAVDYMVETGLMRGTSATTFSPAAETSRGMIAAIL